MTARLQEVFPGTSEMAAVMRAHDWATSPLGPPDTWPDALKIPLRMLLTTRFEMWLGWGPDLLFFYNDAYIPTLGIKHPLMLAKPFREVWSEVYDEVAGQVAKVAAGESTWNNALLLLLERSGFPEETYHSFSYSPLHHADGSVGGLLCVVSEETARVIGARRLETLRTLGTALVGATDVAAVGNAIRRTFAANQRDFPFIALQMEGDSGDNEDADRYRSAVAGLGKVADETGTVFDLPAGTDWPTGGWARPPERAIAITIPGSKDEGAGLVLALNPFRGEDPDALHVARLIAGQIGGALAAVHAMDIERRRGDRMWSVSRDLMVVVDADGVFRSVNPSWSRILGQPVDEVVGRSFSEFMHPDDIAPSNDALAAALDAKELNNYENRFRAVDGTYRCIEWHTTLEDGLVYAYGRDVTERRRVEEKLNRSEEQFRHLVQGVTDYAIYMLDLEGHVSSWNEGARRIKGYEPDEIIGRHFSTFYPAEDRERGEPARALDTAKREGRFLAEGWRVRKSGDRFRASVVIDAIRGDAGRPIGYAKITRDITEREEAASQLEVAREALFQSQKMEAIGQLTGGVAHDFNNLLMAVLSSLDLLRRRLPDDPQSRRLLDNAVEGAQRGATLTQRMLAFARRQELEVDAIDLPGLIAGMNDLVQRSIGPEWPIATHFATGLPAVRADANQLEMALLNLIVNARDATPGGGAITITGVQQDIEEDRTNVVASGSYVRLAVEDVGAGMDAETLGRATEPFFTTKGVGKGTGLGLPMVHGMARQIGGGFELTSIPGRGTTAILWLPVATEAPSDAVETPAPGVAPDCRPLVILAVDDDPLVLMNTVALLEDLGHDVLEAGSGEEAIALFRERADIELLVTDQAMPRMTGVELVAQIDQVHPGLPVIIASGYGEGIEVPGRQVTRLSKPFAQGHLAAAILRAVDPD